MSATALAFSTPSFSERVSNLLDRVDYRLALSDADREAIFKLRYEAYLREGTVTPSFSRRLSDRFDDIENSWVFGIFIDGELASSIRLTVGTSSFPEMPAMGVFADMLEGELSAGKILIDPTRFVADQEFARRFPELPYATVRIGWMAGEYFKADMILATVRTEHQAFYKRVFGHKLMADARPYPSLTKPISLMGLNYFAMKERVHRRYPFFHSTQFERRALFEPFSEIAQKQIAGRAPLSPVELAPDRVRVTG